MMRQRKNKLYIFLLLGCCSAGAQKFTVNANLQPAAADGFYSINITPQLSSYTNVDYSDLRIADDKDQFVPYIIISKQPSFFTHNYSRLAVIKNESADSGKSILIIKNQSNAKISSLALLIRNAAVNRNASISGSDDLNHWFTVIENVNLEKQTVIKTDRYIQTINFPTSSYTFLKITIDNGKNNPLNIIEAGSYTDAEHRKDDSYMVNPSPVFIQTDSSDNNSYIKIHQNAAYHIDRIKLHVESPKFLKGMWI